MLASSAPCTALRSRDAPGRLLLGACLLAAVSLLATWSEACVLPPPFEAMDPINPKPYYHIGEKVEYKCKKGYNRLPFYLMVATCEKNHTWVPITDDGCVKMKCYYLNPPPNGRIDYINETFAWGDQVLFTCVDGFYLVGSERLNCELKDDKVRWSSSVPKCKKILCGPPPKIKNGNYTFNDIDVFEYLEAVTYSCNPVPGPDQLSLVGSEVLYCAGYETWSSAAPECKVVKCPAPVLQNGRQISGFGKPFYYKVTVQFECIAGFYLNGSETIMCGTENAWEPSIPQCIKGPRPTHPVKPPVYNYPGYPNPREGLFDQELNAWIILPIVLVVVATLAVLVRFVYRLTEHHSKSINPTADHKEHLLLSEQKR